MEAHLVTHSRAQRTENAVITVGDFFKAGSGDSVLGRQVLNVLRPGRAGEPEIEDGLSKLDYLGGVGRNDQPLLRRVEARGDVFLPAVPFLPSYLDRTQTAGTMRFDRLVIAGRR